MKERFGALMVLMNGPRYFLMDEITASEATASGKTIGVDGMELTERASIDLGLFRPPAPSQIGSLDNAKRSEDAGADILIAQRPRGRRSCLGQRAARQTCSRRRGGREPAGLGGWRPGPRRGFIARRAGRGDRHGLLGDA